MRRRWRSAAVLLTALAAIPVIDMAGVEIASQARVLPDGKPEGWGPGPDVVLARWKGFPVSAEPRPLVVVDPVDYRAVLDESAEENGFSRGLWTLPASWPSAPASHLGYPILSAPEAAERARQAVIADIDEDFDAIAIPPTPITMTSARLIDRKFLTDRGPILLPAWEFRFGRAHEGRTIALAVTPDRLHDAPAKSDSQSDALLAADERTVTLRFDGDPPGSGPCEAEYTPLVLESPTAVAIGALEHRGPIRDDYSCLFAPHTREVTVPLAQPLGNRVLVSYQAGFLIEVITVERAAVLERTAEKFRECVRRHEPVQCLRRHTSGGLRISELHGLLRAGNPDREPSPDRAPSGHPES